MIVVVLIFFFNNSIISYFVNILLPFNHTIHFILSFFVFFSLHNSSPLVGRSNIKQVAEKRRWEIEKFLNLLFQMADEISHSDLVYTFFHPLLRDQQEASIHHGKLKGMV